MAVVPTITFGGTDINTFGTWLRVGTVGWLDGPEIKVDVSEFTGGVGGVISDTMSIPPRTLSMEISTVGTTLAALRGYEDTLKGYLRQDVTVRFADGTNTREVIGRLRRVDLKPVGIPISPRSDGTLQFLCADPLWRATSSTNEAITGTPNSIALGNAPVSDWVLTITATTNSITDITITLGPNTLTYTGTIAAGQALVIDASDFTVENNGSDDIANYTGGFPLVDPLDSPSVSATKGSGSGTLGGSLVFKARYY